MIFTKNLYKFFIAFQNKNHNFLSQNQLNKLTNRNKFSMEYNQNQCENNLFGICHMRSTHDKEKNFEQVEKICELAKEKSVKFLFLPECCDYVGRNREETLNLAETLNGETVQKYKSLANLHDMWISFGGIHEAITDSDGTINHVYNSHILINNSGNIIGVYRKLHLFDVNTPEFKFRESSIVKKGPKIIEPIETPFGKVGLQICYDMRFPEVSIILRKLGADILTYPSAFAYTTGLAHWEILLRSRAIENQCFVVASAQIGYHNDKRRSYGNAMIINPWGEIIAKCNNDCDIDVAVCNIDLLKIKTVRGNMPCFEHRRDDVYSLCPIELHRLSPSSSSPLFYSSLSNKENENNFRYFEKNRIPCETIFYESEYCFCFTNIRCVVVGHVLIATKRVAKRLNDLTPCEITDLFHTVIKVQKYLESYHKATSSTVNVQDGEHAGQTVKHVHVHLMPRQQDDFLHNDEIYLKLRIHDHNPQENQRSLNEMIEEAQQYREFIEKYEN